MKIQSAAIPISDRESVSALIAVPSDFVPGQSIGIITAHGAGNDMTNPLLVALSEGLAEAGHLTMRFNFPYKEKGRKAPDPQKKLELTWEKAFAYLHRHERLSPGRIVCAGKSMGGRVASQMVAAGALPAARLILLGYPLHPPGNKHKLRDAHLYDISIPMLFFAGTRDPLCDLGLLRKVLAELSAPWTLKVIESGDHSFNTPKSSGIDSAAVKASIVAASRDWLAQD